MADICVLAYSGGLDTSFCIPFIKEKYGYDIVTVMVDTGGFSERDMQQARDRANRLGVLRHTVIDGRYCLRLCIGQTYTTRSHVLAAWQHIRAARAALSGESS